MIKITKLDKKERVFDITVADNHNFYANNILVHNCLESIGPISASKNYTININDNTTIEKYETGYYHCCNLSAINLSVILNDGKLLERACRKAVRMLDKTIELTKAPTTEANNYNDMFRNINVTDLGLADWMAYNKLSYHKEEDWEEILSLYEKIAYYTLDESCNIATEKGSFGMFEKSYFKDGKMIGKTAEELSETSRNPELDWHKLSEKVKKGVRNLMTRAIAPNTSCQDGNNKIITKDGNKSVYDILKEQDFDIKDIECKEPFWIKLKTPIDIPTFEGDDIVKQIWWNGHKEFVEIEFEDGNIYKFTYNHKLMVLKEEGFTEWIECKDLCEGDEILDIRESFMKIKKIVKSNKKIPTYDIEAKKFHHYYLDNGCISHNTSIVMDASASFLPVFNKFSYESMNKMNIPVMPKFIKNRFWNYNESYTIPTEKIINLTSLIQYYIDCSISMELVINPDITDIKKISDAIINGFDNGLKAVYYSRTIQVSEDGEKKIGDKNISCASCSN